LWGIEDPRITYVPELNKYAVVYTAFTRGGPGVALALTEDFSHFERYGMIMSPEDKDAALFPHRIGGYWALIHRPVSYLGGHMWISYSPDLRHWGSHNRWKPLGGWWDANKIDFLRCDRNATGLAGDLSRREAKCVRLHLSVGARAV
jgi:predicted GH43/DUF377 family glycosyl hydrolase